MLYGQMKLKSSFLARNTLYVWREVREAFNQKNTMPTVKHEGGSITLCGCFASSGAGELTKVNGIMKKEDHLQIIQDKLHTSVRILILSRRWVFQHDNDPKHTAKIVLGCLKKKKKFWIGHPRVQTSIPLKIYGRN